MFKRTVLTTIIVLSCSTLTACVSNNRDDDFSNTKNHLFQKILIDANRDERPVVLNESQRELNGEPLPFRIGLERAVSMIDEGQIRLVNYPISNAYDKGNPNSPFHENIDFKYFYHPPLYDGIDNWVLEKGADVNASIEYWLAMDAIDLVNRKVLAHDPLKTRIGGVKPESNAFGRKIKANQMTYADTVEDLGYLLSDLMEYGVDRKTAMVVAHLCLNNSFVKTMRKHEKEYFKVAEDNNLDHAIARAQFDGHDLFDKMKDNLSAYYLGYSGPLQGNNNPACDDLRSKLTKDEHSPFWGDKYLYQGSFQKYNGTYKNQVVETVRIEKPELDVGLWQHLANRDLYKNLGRVREEGLYSGLLYPERAKFVVITSRRIRNAVPFSYLSWSRHFVDHSPLTDARRAAYWMGDTMFSWYYDKEGPLAKRFRTSLSNEFGNFMQSNGQQSRSIAGCQVDPTLVSYQGDDAREFRKFYQCKLGNAVGYGLFSGLRTQFNHVAATSVDPRHEFQAVFEFNGLTTDLREGNKSCDNAEFKGLCEASKPKLLQEKIDLKQSISAFSFEDAVAYTQISEEGRIEGVVLLAGFKVIYDLTDIAHWYQRYNPHDRNQWADLTDRFEYANSLNYQDVRYESESRDGVRTAQQE